MSNKTKILLVEDEATLAVIIRDTLKSQDFEVLTADNGEQGLQMFFREHPEEKLIYANDNNMVSIIPLSHRESEILRLLCRNKGEVVDNKDVLLQLWGDDSYFNTRSLHVFITKLRRKLSRDPRIRIINVRGIGYKLI